MTNREPKAHMMKKTISLTLLSLALIGAGCSAAPADKTSNINEDLEAAIRQQSEASMEIASTVNIFQRLFL